MSLDLEQLSYWVERLGLAVLAKATGFAFLIYFGASAVVLLLELRRSRSTAIIRSRAFMVDVAYAAVYRGGLFEVFFFAVIVNALESQLAFLKLGWLSGLPMILSVPIFWMLGDFFLYWIHRLYHSVPFLWAFHAVHHSERELNTLSTNRRHPVEGALNGLTLYLPLAFVLGIETRAWVPWYVASQILEALHHAQLDWRFGPFYRWIVSPVFHSIHHSTDQKHFDRNFGLMFSVWDYVFRTAAPERERPTRYGVEGLVIRDTISDQLFAPLRLLGWRRPAVPTSPPDPVTSAKAEPV